MEGKKKQTSYITSSALIVRTPTIEEIALISQVNIGIGSQTRLQRSYR